MYKLFLLIGLISINIIACQRLSNHPTPIPSRDSHYDVMVGHLLVSTAVLSREMSFSYYYQNQKPTVHWDIDVPPCPDGWHLPDDQEWEKLTNHLNIYNTDREKNTWYI